MYKVRLYKDAAKYYKRLEAKMQKRLDMAIEDIIKSPFEGMHIKKLKGRLEGKYRYDVGGIRIIYCMDANEETVYVEAIGPRGDIYK